MASQVLPVSSSAAGWSRSTFAAAKSPSSSCGKKALCVSSSSARKGLDLGADLSLHGKGISQRMPTAGRKLHVSAAVAEDRRIEQESMLSEKPTTLLREGEDSDDKNGLRARFEQMVFRIQNDVCAAVEAIDGGKFREDAWSRPGGGGGVSRVLQVGLCSAIKVSCARLCIFYEHRKMKNFEFSDWTDV